MSSSPFEISFVLPVSGQEQNRELDKEQNQNQEQDKQQNQELHKEQEQSQELEEQNQGQEQEQNQELEEQEQSQDQEQEQGQEQEQELELKSNSYKCDIDISLLPRLMFTALAPSINSIIPSEISVGDLETKESNALDSAAAKISDLQSRATSLKRKRKMRKLSNATVNKISPSSHPLLTSKVKESNHPALSTLPKPPKQSTSSTLSKPSKQSTLSTLSKPSKQSSLSTLSRSSKQSSLSTLSKPSKQSTLSKSPISSSSKSSPPLIKFKLSYAISAVTDELLTELLHHCYVTTGHLNGRRIFCKPYTSQKNGVLKYYVGYVTFTDLIREVNLRYHNMTCLTLGRYNKYVDNDNNNDNNNNNNNRRSSPSSFISDIFSQLMHPCPYIEEEEEKIIRDAMQWFLNARKLIEDLLHRSTEDVKYSFCFFRGWDRLVGGTNTGKNDDAVAKIKKDNERLEFLVNARENRRRFKDESLSNPTVDFLRKSGEFVKTLCMYTKYG